MRPFVVDEQHRKIFAERLELLMASLDGLDGQAAAIPDARKRLRKVRKSIAALDDGVPCLREAIDGRTVRHMDSKTLVEAVASAVSN